MRMTAFWALCKHTVWNRERGKKRGECNVPMPIHQTCDGIIYDEEMRGMIWSSNTYRAKSESR